MHKLDLGKLLFYDDLFYWDEFKQRKGDYLDQLFRMKRVKDPKARHSLFNKMD